MDAEDLTPEQVKKAKALAKGPLGLALSKVPLLFARTIFFGPPPTAEQPCPLNSGTVTLIELGERRVAVTCHHVIETFRQRRADDPRLVIQVGNYNFDPEDHILDESADLDLAVLDFTNVPTVHLTPGPWLGTTFHQPHEWPPLPVKTGDYVSIGGYPGALREQRDTGEFDFHSLPLVGVPIRAAAADRMVIQLEREFWVENYEKRPSDLFGFQDFGGMSGGPVVVERKRSSGIIGFDVVGVIYECSPELDLILVRPLSLVREDGTIARL